MITVTGDVVARAAEAVNPNLATGAIEVRAREVSVQSVAAELPLPVAGEAEYPEDIAAGEPWWEAHVRERREGAYSRAAAALAHLRARHEERDRIAIVTHGAFGSVLLSVALGCPPTDQNRFSQYNCALSLLEITEEGARLHHQNRVEHLPEGLRTDPT